MKKLRSNNKRPAPPTSQIEPAPDCLPDTARMPVTVQVKGWRNPIICSVVRIEPERKQVLLALPTDLAEKPLPPAGSQGLIGWSEHSAWHESPTTFGKKSGTRFFWMKLRSGPFHNERRRYVRGRQIRPVAIHAGRHRVDATSMDMSEAAMRLIMAIGEPVHSGSKVHMIFKTAQRLHGDGVPMAIDGHVYRTRELDGGQKGMKEVVIFFENLSPSQEDFIRGLTFDMHLQSQIPTKQEE